MAKTTYERLKSRIREQKKNIREDKSLSASEKEKIIEFLCFKREELDVAHDLFYPDDTLDRIWLAETEGEVLRAMITARQAAI